MTDSQRHRDRRRLARYAALVTLLLATPVVPFVLAGARFEQRLEAWLEDSLSAPQAAVLVAGALACDVLLPVPSSLLSTWAGARLGVVPATAAIGLGMLAGAALGYLIGRVGGRPLALRWIAADDLLRLDDLVERQGWWMLIVTRPLPVLAEAAALLAGALGMPSWSFLAGVAPVSLAMALAYATLGSYAGDGEWLLTALAGSVAAPLGATWLVRRALSHRLAGGE